MKTTSRRRQIAVWVAGVTAAAGMATLAPAPAVAAPGAVRMMAAHSNKFVTEGSNTIGASVDQRNTSFLLSQKWRLSFYFGSAQIINEESKLCLQPETSDVSFVRMQPCRDPKSPETGNQRWRDDPRLLNGVQVHRYRNLDSDMCLDVSGASQLTGARLSQFPCNGQTNQMFQLSAA